MKNFTRPLCIAFLAMLSFVSLSSQVNAPLEDGGYLIKIKESQGLLDNGGYPDSDNPNVGGWYPQASVYQRWILTKIEDGYYKIQSVLADSAIITVDGASDNDEVNIIQAKWEDSDYQKWEIKALENGWFKVISKGSGKAWHAMNTNDPDHAIQRSIVQLGDFESDLQEFAFIATADSVAGSPAESTKSYVIASECTQMVMSEDLAVNDSGNVVQLPYVGESSQQWQFDWVEDVAVEGDTVAYYKVTNRGSGLVMSLSDTAVGDGVNVITKPWSDDAEMQKYQLWSVAPIVGVEDQNHVNVFSRMNGGRTIEIQGGPQWNAGQNLTTWWRFENPAEWERWQRWRLIMIEASPLSVPKGKVGKASRALKLYPNPAKGSCRIRLHATYGVGSIDLYDLNGRQIRHGNYGFVDGQNEISYSLDGITEGLYFLRISLPDGYPMMNKILVE